MKNTEWIRDLLRKSWPYQKAAYLGSMSGLFFLWLIDELDWDFLDTQFLVTALIVGAAVGLAIRAVWRSFISDLAVESPTWSNAGERYQEIRTLVTQLRIRSSRLKLIARLVLVANAGLLLLGVWVFLYAEQLVQTSERKAFASALKPLAHDAIRQICSGSVANETTDELMGDAIVAHGSLATTATKSSEKNENACAQWMLVLQEAKTQPQFRTISSSLIGSRIEQTAELEIFDYAFANHLVPLLKMHSAEVTGAQNSVSSSTLSTLTTRIGIVLMLMFLMQTLVTLYRYNTRLASFYDSRADALQLACEFKDVPLDALIGLLATEKLDFGKQPASPLDHAIEIVKSMPKSKS
jgi:hypothetical protein